MFDVLPLHGVALEMNESRRNRRHDLSSTKVVAWLWHNVEHTRPAIQVPLARLIEAFENILDDVASPVLAEIVGEDLAFEITLIEIL